MVAGVVEAESVEDSGARAVVPVGAAAVVDAAGVGTGALVVGVENGGGVIMAWVPVRTMVFEACGPCPPTV